MFPIEVVILNVSQVKLRLGIGLIAFCTLVLELTLIRVFDVILTPSMGYAVITATIFALGLGGIYLYVFPMSRDRVTGAFAGLFISFAVSSLLLLPVINGLPFELNISGGSLTTQVLAWGAMYLMLIVPFFIAGMIISLILTHYSEHVHALYFSDLLGAGIGCVVLIPLIPHYGPGGIQWLVAGAAILAAILFLQNTWWRLALILCAAFLVAFPNVHDGYLEYSGHANKREVDDWKARGLRNYVAWDPVSKLEVFTANPRAYNFALDGGQQGSWLIAFDGDYARVRREIEEQPHDFYFGLNSTVHYFKRGTNPEVLIIGAAVGGETNAALIFGAKHIDAIELVGAMVNAAKTRYAQYSGGVFIHPRVDYRVGEGRTFLRATTKRYDIIQMFSNHTSSSIADGSGAVAAAYLQTAEAYEEYFTHLTPDGVIQINHHLYPRILTTAALAWRRLGLTDFSRHVLVIERWIPDTLPTVLIKMTPWTQQQVDDVVDYLNREPLAAGIGERFKPSDKVYKGHPFEARLHARRPVIDRIALRLATYHQPQLDYDVTLEIRDSEQNLLRKKIIAGADISDNKRVVMTFTPLENVRGQDFWLILRADNDNIDKAFSVWVKSNGDPLIDFERTPASFVVAFHPIHQGLNLIPQEFLEGPFPTEMGNTADYLLTSVTDDNPYFGMIRKHTRMVSALNSEYMDGGTEYFLNIQLLPFLSSDWLNLFLVAVVSVIFSVVFIFVPLFFSQHGRARWPAMGTYLLYFSCLGAGFIIIELVFVQLFKKLIGYPTHTYTTVIFALLISAGFGSLLSKPLRLGETGRWIGMFTTLIVLGIVFVFSYHHLFHLFLAYPLPFRILAAVAMLFPLGFLMGMPFPMGVHRLGQIEEKAIPWAWGMNGFFTVFGGFLAIVLSILLGFQVVLLLGFAIYLLAFFAFARIRGRDPA